MHKTRDATSPDLIIGIRPLIEAIEAGREIDKIYLQKNLKGQLFKELWGYLKEHKLPYQVVPADKLNQFTRKNHQGVVTQVSAVESASLESIVSETFAKGEDPLIIVLDRISDVRNFGAIARTAEAAGAHALVIGNRQSAAVNEDAVKSSAGALYHLPLCRENNLNETLQWLHQSGLKVAGCTEKAEKTIYEANLTGPLALVMGAEDKGIAPERQKLCSHLVKLPMAGQIGSLNVSVATGAVLYEVVRQRSL